MLHPPYARYDGVNNQMMAIMNIPIGKIVGVYRGTILNGQQYRRRATNRDLCVRLPNEAGNQRYFNTEPYGWQFINATVQGELPNCCVHVEEDIELPMNHNKVLVVFSAEVIEIDTVLSIPFIE